MLDPRASPLSVSPIGLLANSTTNPEMPPRHCLKIPGSDALSSPENTSDPENRLTGIGGIVFDKQCLV